MQNAGLDKAQAGIKIARRNINNLQYADDVVSSNFWMPQNGSFPPLHSASNPVTITKKIFTTIHNILK